MVSGKPALILTRETLFVYQTGITIEWKDIKGFNLGGQKSSYITIRLNQPDKYLQRIKNPFSKLFYRVNSKLFGNTFFFTVSLIKGNDEKLFETLNDYLILSKK
jgi:hypothetical protein